MVTEGCFEVVCMTRRGRALDIFSSTSYCRASELRFGAEEMEVRPKRDNCNPALTSRAVFVRQVS